MDFKSLTRTLLEGFQRGNIRYAMIGGFALGALGVPRATTDIDFLVHHEDLPKIRGLMQKMGYECTFQSENVSQYTSPLKVFGEIDFLHAFRKVSLGMLERATEKETFGGELRIKVLRPEDIIGLKVQAAANDEARFNREYMDIEALMAHYKIDLDWELIKEYFSIFDQQILFNKLKGKYLETE